MKLIGSISRQRLISWPLYQADQKNIDNNEDMSAVEAIFANADEVLEEAGVYA